jgi:hypothetical protein
MSKKVEKDRMGMIIREEDTPEKMEVEITEIKAPCDEDSPVLIYYILVQEVWNLCGFLSNRMFRQKK